MSNNQVEILVWFATSNLQIILMLPAGKPGLVLVSGVINLIERPQYFPKKWHPA
jgi:hypothetical protein